jgi:hypothetical protein
MGPRWSRNPHIHATFPQYSGNLISYLAQAAFGIGCESVG